MQRRLKTKGPVSGVWKRFADDGGRRIGFAILELLFVFLAVGLISGDVALCATAARARLQHDLFSVSFANENQGWASGRWGTILHTTDGGKAWTPQASGTDYTLASIYSLSTRKMAGQSAIAGQFCTQRMAVYTGRNRRALCPYSLWAFVL